MLSLLIACALQPQDMPAPNTLTKGEQRGGWKLLFDGKTTNGWHNFKGSGVSSGWQIVDGELKIVDAGKAGDIVSNDIYEWFELKIDYKVGKGQNSGIMFHVQEKNDTPWQSGPEIQVFDNAAAKTGQMAGWLYDLVPAQIDATNPAGEWNTVHLKLRKGKSEVSMNGKFYYNFEINSADFRERIAKSKFHVYEGFGQFMKGAIGLQGDHGNVSFRNIKIKKLKG